MDIIFLFCSFNIFCRFVLIFCHIILSFVYVSGFFHLCATFQTKYSFLLLLSLHLFFIHIWNLFQQFPDNLFKHLHAYAFNFLQFISHFSFISSSIMIISFGLLRAGERKERAMLTGDRASDPTRPDGYHNNTKVTKKRYAGHLGRNLYSNYE